MKADLLATPDLGAVPPAPRTPSPRARSLIFAYTGSQRGLLLVGLAFLLLGLPFPIIFCAGLPTDLLLDLAGRQVAGTVLSTAPAGYEVNNQAPTRIRFKITLDGVEHQGSLTTLDRQWERPVEPGTPLELEVFRPWPWFARLAGQTASFFGWFGLIVLVFPAIGAGMTGWAIRSNRREMRAFIHGTPVLARVVHLGPDRAVKINGRHPYRVEWEFRVAEVVYTGSFTTMKMLEIEEFDVREVVVLFDPDNPAVNTLWVA